METKINVTFDLATAPGRDEFRRMFGHLLTPAPVNQGLGSLPLPPSGEAAAAAAPSLEQTKADAAKLAARQEAAAKARAAKAAKQQPVEQVLGPDDLNGGANGGNLGDQLVSDEGDADDWGLADPSMSPEEAKEAAFVLIRQLFAANKQSEVRDLRKKYEIVKYSDLPVERAHEFYREVLAISHKVMGPQA